MKKLLLLILFITNSLMASVKLETAITYKDYENSSNKKYGKMYDIRIHKKHEKNNFTFSFEHNHIQRENAKKKIDLPSLKTEKYGLLYTRHITNTQQFKFSFLNIQDNLSVTDDGRVYSIGYKIKFPKAVTTKADVYFSDFDTFNVSQYDLTLIKGFMIQDLKLKTFIGAKSIHIHGDTYGNYSFDKKHYLTGNIGLHSIYKNYFLNANAFMGSRVFTALHNGLKMQHHAMKQNKTYAIKMGKRLNDFELSLQYTHMKSEELPSQTKEVRSKFYTLNVQYKF
jgi:hypothetical protein